jgi:hypothetical protein
MLTWRSTPPGDTVVADDIARVTSLLRDLAPLVGDQPDLPAGERRRLGEAMDHATDTLADVGRWNRRTLERIGHAHHVLVPAHTLTGGQVTDDAIRAAAKLDRRYTPVPDSAIDTCGPLFARTYPSVNVALIGAGGLALKVETARTSVSGEGVDVVHAPIARRR